MTTTTILYHSDCPDGWTAAWVADRALREQQNITPDLIPVSHGTPPPDLTGIDEVYVVDFSYPHDTLVEIAQGGKRMVTVLDHHRSALNDIAINGLGLVTAPERLIDCSMDAPHPYACVIDMNRSGAGITWDYFHPHQDRPEVVDYVEDRDLWRFNLMLSNEVNACIRCQPHTLEAWDELANTPALVMAEVGRGAMLHIKAYCRAAINHAYWCTMGDRRFPIVNISYESCSDVANYMLDEFDCDMVGYFFERRDGMWQYGFRSRGDVTVHNFAEQFGGGGHPKASGCTVDRLTHRRA